MEFTDENSVKNLGGHPCLQKSFNFRSSTAGKQEKKSRMKARKDGLFQKHFWYTDKTGERKQKVVYGSTQAEAQKTKTDFLADVKAGLRVDKASITVSEWINDFLAVCQGDGSLGLQNRGTVNQWTV